MFLANTSRFLIPSSIVFVLGVDQLILRNLFGFFPCENKSNTRFIFLEDSKPLVGILFVNDEPFTIPMRALGD